MNLSNSNKTTALHTTSDSPHMRAKEQLAGRGLTAADLPRQSLSIGGAAELLAFHAQVVVSADALEWQNTKTRAATTYEYVQKIFESGSGDPHIIQAPGYPFVRIGEASRLFFQASDTTTRVDTIRTVVQRDIPIGACIALAGVHDNDSVVRANSLAALRPREPLKSLEEARRLLGDVDATVRDVARRAISSLPGEITKETE